MANLFDQLERVAWIPIEMTGFHQWKIIEQWFVWLLWVLCRPYYTTFKVIGYLFFCHFWSKHISQYRTWIADRSAKLTSWISFELQWRINTYPRSFLWQFKHCGCNSLEWALIYFRLLSVIFISCQNWTGNQGNNHVGVDSIMNRLGFGVSKAHMNSLNCKSGLSLGLIQTYFMNLYLH